jgi:hypothetical protein
MHDASCPNLHEEEHVESSKPSSHHNQEIAGDDGLGVIADKRGRAYLDLTTTGRSL